jgi:REP element-mobilizing transposase RayT
MTMTALKPDTSYHIFNHANGFENIFLHEANYYYFLEKYLLYINPIAETYAYCLMPNHFHIIVRIRKRNIIEEIIRKKENNFENTFSKVPNFGKGVVNISNSEILKYISKQFANLFSCYTQSFNKVYHRKGSLFIKNFKRQTITDKEYFLHSVIYVHRNPVHHGFCNDFNAWTYSSYRDVFAGEHGFTENIKLLKLFDGLEIYLSQHQTSLEKLAQIDDFNSI